MTTSRIKSRNSADIKKSSCVYLTSIIVYIGGNSK
jgi:hypothetical protein